MLALPADIQLVVLDYIRSKADLKALCVTSKACHQVALPRLYYHVDLVTWDSGHLRLKRFVRCMSKGAGNHLRYTRSLKFQNTQPPSEPKCQLTGALEFKPHLAPESKDGATAADTVDSFILVLLEMFPDHGLRKFG